jgi:CheY-specific phosphatase CheX
MNAVTVDSFAGLTTIALERMAFVLAEPRSITPAEVLVQAAAHATIAVHGREHYTVLVSATPGIVREVASGMMGIDAEEIDVDDHARSTVAELANILAGELIMLLTGGDSQMSLGLPQEATDEQAGAVIDGSTRGGGCRCVVGNDDGCLLIAVQQDGAAG